MKLVALLSALVFAFDGQPNVSPSIDTFLSESFGVSRLELMTLRNGRPIVRPLPSTDDREISSVGVIKVDVAPRDYVEQLRDITEFKRSDLVPQIGTFGVQPAARDVARLTLPDDDRRDLARCRPGRCDVQLPSEAMQRISRAVEWNTLNETEQVNSAFRAELVRIATNYLELGEGGMPVYHDIRVPTSMAVEFRSMVWDEPALLREFDSLSEHFRRFPLPTAGIEDLLYWSREKVGRAEVISITHLAIHALSDRAPVAFIAASRQVYSTHYFDASLGITLLLSDVALQGSTVVVYANRSRADVFGGLLGPMKRSIAASRSRAALEKVLIAMRARVEQRAAAE
jgi:hypothetical protein